MTFSENLTEFVGKPVTDWSLGVEISDPAGTAYRIGVTWEDGEEGLTWTDRFAAFLDAPGSERVSSLIVGAWDGMTEQTGTTAPVVEALVAAHDRLPRLAALFLGDVTYEECEVSWLQQSDVSALFSAFPRLEHFAVRGGSGLSLGQIRHDQLRSLIVQSGGLPAGVVREVGAADLPALEHLELWLGDDGYGGDSTADDLDLILSGDRFPRLHYLGLRDSHIADQVAAAVARSPLLRRIKSLDLSMGTLGDDGAGALLGSPAVARLEKLDIHHHYCSPEVVARLEALGIPLDASEREPEEEHGRYVAVGE